MADKKVKVSKKEQELLKQIEELTADLQRTRADFENYRKRVDVEKTTAREYGEASVILKILPIIDNINRAISHLPEDLKDNAWAQGVNSLTKNVEKSLESLSVKKIDSSVGSEFNPDLQEAVQFEEDTEGDKEVVAEELQAGYSYKGSVIRHAMVRVARK